MAREIGFWKKVGTYITPVFTSGVDFLVRGANKYINFNSITGESGYGIRDNNGTIEVKSSGGSWSTISTGGGEANTAANLGAGTGIFESKVGVELRFKSLVAGTGMGISSDGTTITLTATSGSGDVVGPASATDDNIATFDTTTGKLIQDGGATIAQVRDRSTHTGTQAISTVTGLQTALDGKAASSHTHTASEVTDFDTEVSNNTDVAANTAARHDAVTKAGTGTYISLSGQEITADPIDVSDLAAAAVVTEAEGIASNDNDTTIPTSAAVKAYADSVVGTPTVDVVSNVATSTILGRTTAGSGDSEELTATQVRTLLNVEDGADVTDTANVTAAGALMDSEVTNLAAVKAFDPTDYATAAQGATADSALQDITGENLGSLANVTESTPGNDEVLQYVTDHWENQTLAEAGIQAVLAEGAFVDGDKTKLNGIETGADVTDTANVTSAGALMDSELTDINAVKALADAAASDVNTGTSTTMFVTPDALAGSNLGIRYVSVTLNGSTALTTSDKAYFRVPAALTGMNLVSVAATVGTGAAGSSSSGTPTFVVTNVTDAASMLSTNLTVDANEYTSATAATAAVIDTATDDVVTDDLISVTCTTAGTGVTYATITLGWQLP